MTRPADTAAHTRKGQDTAAAAPAPGQHAAMPFATTTCTSQGGTQYDARTDPPSTNCGGSVNCWIRDEDQDSYYDVHYCACGNSSNCKSTAPDSFLDPVSNSGIQYNTTTPQPLDDCDDTVAGETGLNGTVPGANINPGETETWYDDVDENCDGKNDFDQDGDGYVATAYNSYASGTAPNGGDCDDSNVDKQGHDASGALTTVHTYDIYPGATEIWYDGVIENCNDPSDYDQDGDGQDCAPIVDSRCTGTDCVDDPVNQSSDAPYVKKFTEGGGASSPVTGCMLDADSDGYGSATPSTALQNFGVVAGNDCDDSLDTVYPGATEVIGDSIDQNCDGNLTCYKDADSDRYGTDAATNNTVVISASVYTSCSQPTQHASAVGTDCVDDPSVTDAATTYPRTAVTPGGSRTADQTYESTSGCYDDADNDGYGAEAAAAPAGADAGTDCNDGDAGINPGATDTIGDNIDQNCDGNLTCYKDADGDGFGTDAVSSNTIDISATTYPNCSQSAANASAVNTDCVDDPATSHAAQTYPRTVYGGSGTRLPTETLESSPGCYTDVDGDGYGASSGYPSGADAGTDCNDGNASIHPGATDTPGDSIDQNCDGSLTCYKDADGDGFGTDALSGNTIDISATTYSSCSQPAANASAVNTDCVDDPATTFAAQTYPRTLYGGSGTRLATETLESSPGCYTDVDGDGYGAATGYPAGADAGTDCIDDPSDSSLTSTGVTAAEVYPTATDVPGDQVDQNCDGSLTCYLDDDGDGQGTSAGTTVTVADTSGYTGSCDTTGASSNDLDCVDSHLVTHAAQTYTRTAVTPGGPRTSDQTYEATDGCYTDVDDDGYGAETGYPSGATAGTDCNDGDATVNPGAAEIIGDNLDQNCDGQLTCYLDDDQDGYGTDSTSGNYTVTISATTYSSCEQPSQKASSNNTDCVDKHTTTNAAYTYPRTKYSGSGTRTASETLEATAGCYTDVDEDGYGSESPPSGADAGTDCNDNSATAYPGAPEIVGDSIDQDCNGNLTCYYDGDADGHGTEAATGNTVEIATSYGSCDQPSLNAATAADDCDDDYPTVYPGATEVCDGFVDDCNSWTGSTSPTPPADEVDDDGDHYVDCSFATTTTGTGTFTITAANYGGGSTGIVGDDDCDDTNAAIYPSAPELCDGYANDCSTDWTGTFPNQTANLGSNEIDNDGDGYVECTFSSGVTAGNWGNTQSPPVVGGGDCDDADANTFPRTVYVSGTRTSSQTYESSAGCYRDADNDGWGDASATTPVDAGTDCVDDDATIYPGAPELCDGKDNNCNDYTSGSPNLPSDEIDADGDGYVPCDFSPGVTSSNWGNTQTPPVIGGGDCNDAAGDKFAVYTHPYAATKESDPSLCMKDYDGDGYGDEYPAASGVTAGTDCDDSSDVTYPGVASQDSATACMKDTDGDGYGDDSPVNVNVTPGTDCVDSGTKGANGGGTILAANINPGASEIWYDGVDENCDGHSDYDQDFDGQDCELGPAPYQYCPADGTDCVDDPVGVLNDSGQRVLGKNIFATNDRMTNEIWYDGVDENCDGENDYDKDGDGYVATAYNDKAGGTAPGTDDCQDDPDNDPLPTVDSSVVNSVDVHPGATEVWYDGVDENCDGKNDFDKDGDGYVATAFNQYKGGTATGQNDCEDDPGNDPLPTDDGSTVQSSQVHPTATEVWYDGIDENCDGKDDFDQDGDGYIPDTYISDYHTYLARYGYSDTRTCTAEDGSCNDCDDDPASITTTTGTTLTGAQINPGATEVYYDGVDQNCDGHSDYDADFDGYDCDGSVRPDLCPGHTGKDCDDTTASIAPNVPEVCESNPLNQVDQDCDGNPNTQGGVYFHDNTQLGAYAHEYYLDLDRDGYGEANSTPYWLCSKDAEPDPTLFSTNDTDCNDNDADIHPDALEKCNGVDDNCNGLKDEPTEGNTPNDTPGCSYYYLDGDHDSVGSDSTTAAQQLCVCQGFATNPSPYISTECNPYATPDPNAPAQVEDPNETVTVGGVSYPVVTSVSWDNQCWSDLNTDCADNNAAIHPPVAGQAGTEIIDGKDNDCDGRIPIVELDCDNDGSYAMVPDESKALTGFTSAADLGLPRCDSGTGYSPPILNCLGASLNTECDSLTGLWMVTTSQIPAKYWSDGRRIGQTTGCDGWDCDDNCADRCSGAYEVCDGIDNDCDNELSTSGHSLMASADSVSIPGLPPSMDVNNPPLGHVDPTELDLDGDELMTCTTSANSTQSGITDRGCSKLTGTGDCNDKCDLINPGGTQDCDGFINATDCSATNPEKDADGDGYDECGAFGQDNANDEQVFLLVHADGNLVVRQDGTTDTKIVPLIPPRTKARACDAPLTTALDALRVLPDNLPDGPYGASDPGASTWWTKSLKECIEADSCKHEYEDPSYRPTWPSQSECENYWWTGSDPTHDYKYVQCGEVVLNLADGLDAGIYSETSKAPAQAAAWAQGCMDSQTQHPEQVITRTEWLRNRIIEARQLVIEWECYRTTGNWGCDNDATAPDGWTPYLEGRTPGVKRSTDNTYYVSDNLTSTLLTTDPRWWPVMNRFSPSPPSALGSLEGCWGSPDGGLAGVTNLDHVGGDCDGSSTAANRDTPEGPDDLVAVYDGGTPPDCSTCLDGIDNNCNGLTDCQDPACARCFVGQGVGCSAAAGNNKCTQTGCSSSGTEGSSGPTGIMMLLGLAMAALTMRRKERKVR